MTNLELQNYIIGKIHRTDLATTVPTFIEAARIKINRRFGLSLAPLTNDSSTNAVLTDWPDLYQFESLRAAYEWLNDGDNATYYGQRFEQECANQNLTAESIATDQYADEPPQIKVS